MNKIIKIQNVRGYEKDGVVYLNLEDTARGLGFTQQKHGTEYVRWYKVIEYLQDFNFPLTSEEDSQQNMKDNYIPENIFYRLAMKAKNEVAEKFQKAVSSEVIPAIRKGVVNLMKNTMQIFKNEEFDSIRVVEKDSEGWLVASDVCREIDVQNTSDALSRLDDDEKSTIVLTESATNGTVTHKVSIINEAGFYRLVLSSRKKDERVKNFQRWVTHEVLPSIRKHGAYMTVETLDEIADNPDLLIKLAQNLKAEREEKKRLQEVVNTQSIQIEEMKPKASYYDLVLQSKEAIPISIIAKDYGWSAKTMNSYLHSKKVQYKLGNIWLLYRKYAKSGYTTTKTHTLLNDDGEQRSYVHTYWTQKGRLFIYNLLKSENILPLIEKNSKAVDNNV